MAWVRDKGSPADRRAAAGHNRRMDSWAWKKRVARERRRLERDPALAKCWICGEPIDMDLPVGHRLSFTLDHLVPISRGGDIDGDADPAHLSCNSSRGDGRKKKRGATPNTLLDW